MHRTLYGADRYMNHGYYFCDLCNLWFLIYSTRSGPPRDHLFCPVCGVSGDGDRKQGGGSHSPTSAQSS